MIRFLRFAPRAIKATALVMTALAVSAFSAFANGGDDVSYYGGAYRGGYNGYGYGLFGLGLGAGLGGSGLGYGYGGYGYGYGSGYSYGNYANPNYYSRVRNSAPVVSQPASAPYLTNQTYEPGDGYRYPLYYNPATGQYFYHPLAR